MTKNSNYKTRLATIKALVFDVDGVISNGSILLDGAGEWVRNMHVRDGLAMKLAMRYGIKVCVITAGSSKKVKERFQYLGIESIFMSVENKREVLDAYLKEQGILLEETLYMGDDLLDIKCLKAVGVSTCPNDAILEVRAICDYISHFDGGNGAVRDVIEQTLKIQGFWDDILKEYTD